MAEACLEPTPRILFRQRNSLCTNFSLTAAVTQEGHVVCWGYGGLGGSDFDYPPILENECVVAVSCGCTHIVVLLETGSPFSAIRRSMYRLQCSGDGSMGDQHWEKNIPSQLRFFHWRGLLWVQ
jgi:alpha-tubulin suppressor-like RCC1 family protein